MANTNLRACFVLLVCLLPGAVQAADVYRWTDAQGRTQYGAIPPPGVKATLLARPAPPSPLTEAEAKDKAQRLKDQALDLERQREQEQLRQQAQAQSDAQATNARRQRCAVAAEQLLVVQRGGPVWRYDERHERVLLPDSQRDAEIARLQSEVRSNCDPGWNASQDAAINRQIQQSARSSACETAREEAREMEIPERRIPAWQLEAAREKARRACGP